MREMKGIIGVPDGFHATVGREKFGLSFAPVRFIGQEGPEAEAANVFVRAAAEEFIYRDSVSTAAFVPKMETVLADVLLNVVVLRDLIVRRNATLVIPRGVDRLTLRDMTIERGGRLVIKGSNVLIRARSSRGQIPPSPGVTQGFNTATTAASRS